MLSGSKVSIQLLNKLREDLLNSSNGVIPSFLNFITKSFINCSKSLEFLIVRNTSFREDQCLLINSSSLHLMNIQRYSIYSIINTTIELLKDSFFTSHSSFPSKCLFNGHRILSIARIANHHGLIQSNEIITPNSRLINLSSRDYCTRSRVQISSQSTSTTTIFLTSSIDILSYINKALAELDKFLIDILNGIYHFLIVRIVLDIISSIKTFLHTSSKSNQVGRLSKILTRESYIAIFRCFASTTPFKTIILFLKEFSSIDLLFITKAFINI